MPLRAAIITVKHINLAVVLVDPESTHPATAAPILRHAERVFPTLPILLLAPRVQGFSPSYATFQYDSLIGEINADAIDWQPCWPVERDHPPPF